MDYEFREDESFKDWNGKLTETLISAMVEDNKVSNANLELTPAAQKMEYKTDNALAASQCYMQNLERGLRTTLGALGIMKPPQDEEDQVLLELRKAQMELHTKTIECNIQIAHLNEHVTTVMSTGEVVKLQALRDEITVVEQEIERGYFQRQAALRSKQTIPKTALDALQQNLTLRSKLIKQEAQAISAIGRSLGTCVGPAGVRYL
eukprot:m.178081 g.178081  ORF g.178081 m.178081 type:complete len:206 (+) comp31922_c1_seq1:183-800(+)